MSTPLAEGLYLHLGPMPCLPQDITVPKYVLPMTFGRAESEEAAARLLTRSLEENAWVGVSWRTLVATIGTELTLPLRERPLSYSMLTGPNALIQGFHELLGERMVHIEPLGEDSILYPTASMVETVMRIQGVTKAAK